MGRVSHRFPEPLNNGYLKFNIRRSKDELGKLVEYKRFHIAFISPQAPIKSKRKAFDEVPIAITTEGKWMNEVFQLWKRLPKYTKTGKKAWAGSGWTTDGIAASQIKFKENEWQEVIVQCRTGKNAEILVDGISLGELPVESIAGVRLYTDGWNGIFLDDVELFYEGDAESLEKNHKDLVKQDLVKRQAIWKKEAETEAKRAKADHERFLKNLKLKQ